MSLITYAKVLRCHREEPSAGSYESFVQVVRPASRRCDTIPRSFAPVKRLKSRGRIEPKQIVVVALRKLLVLCFGVLIEGLR